MPFHIDTVVLKSFIAIAETESFSRAADHVGRSQAAVSLQIKKLEDNLQCRLFERSGHAVHLTEAGELFLGYARRMIELQWEVYHRLHKPNMRGEIALGTPEDFATHYLPGILASFTKHHPHVKLHVTCDLTLNLLQLFHKKKLDIVLVKRDPERVKGGTKVWREPLVWAAADSYQVRFPLPLVLAPQPCIYRARALAALDRVRRPWHIAYVSPSLAGTVAAVKAGLGVTVLPATMVPQGLVPLKNKADKLPHLADSEIALIKRDDIVEAGKALATHITSLLEQSVPRADDRHKKKL